MKTNEQRLKSLIRELDKSHSIYSALLRERIVHMMDITLTSIEQEPEKWKNGFVHPNLYKDLNDIVVKHLGFDQN